MRLAAGLAALATAAPLAVTAVSTAAVTTAVTAAAAPAAHAGITQDNAAGLVRLRAVDVMSGTGTSGWGADDGYDGGDRETLDTVSTAGVAKAAPASVYTTGRYGKQFTYTLRDLRPGATYTIRTHSIETYWSGAGQRVFSIAANGRTVVSNLDLVAVAGPRKPVVREFTATATAAGQVVLSFTATKDNATVAGIEVLRAGTATAPAAPTGVHAAALSTRSVLVDWKGDVEASGYTVYRDGRRLATTALPAYNDQTAVPGARHVYSVVATGATFRVSRPSAKVTVAVPTTTAGATGRYRVAGGVVLDPAGRTFVPVGANLGTPSTASGKGVADGHAAAAKAWGWNAVRLTFYASDQYWWNYRAQNGYPALLDEVWRVVDEYRKAGIVVVIDGHDNPQYDANPERVRTQMNQFWGDVAAHYKGDSGVWFNLINEPQTLNDAWYEEQARFLSTIRATGNQSIAVVDAPVWGQDLGGVGPWFLGSRFAYSATMAPRLAARYGNVVLSQHNYGAFDMYTTPESYGAYAKTVQRTGLALVTGETGYTIDGSTTAGGYDQNRRATLATFASNPVNKVGTFVWNATHNDSYSLKANGDAFFAGPSAGANLSDMGQRFWKLSH